MPRFHFDLVDSITIASEGHEVANAAMALDLAEQVGRRLVQERPKLANKHFFILVSDEDGEEVGRIPLDYN